MMLPLDELTAAKSSPTTFLAERARDVAAATSVTSSSAAPAGPELMNSTQDWVAWVGCVHLGYDRECDDCGLAWSNADPSRRAVPRERRSPGIEHKDVMLAGPLCPQTAVSATTLARRGNA